MQPYFFPYIGYFQYLFACDKFVFYDNVNFITRGWINRNYINGPNGKTLLTIPLVNSSPNKTIRETMICHNGVWQKKILRTIEINYKKAIYFERVFPIIEEVVNNNSESIADIAALSISAVADYIGVDTKIEFASSRYMNAQLDKVERLIDICAKEKAETLILPNGAIDLYRKDNFTPENITPYFIKSEPVGYTPCFKHKFIPNLSIIDVIMQNSVSDTRNLLTKYVLV